MVIMVCSASAWLNDKFFPKGLTSNCLGGLIFETINQAQRLLKMLRYCLQIFILVLCNNCKVLKRSKKNNTKKIIINLN